MIELVEVKSRSDLRRFVTLAERLYRGNAYYVPKLIGDEMNTLRSDRNPAFEYCEARYWMALRDGEPVGRIAGIISRRYNETWKKKRARFGWVDFVDDPAVSAALFGAVEEWARSRGLEEVHGPLGFCDLDREGMLIQGFDELDMLITNYNYPYYPVHLERLGYAKDVDWLEHLLTNPGVMPERLDRIARVALQRSGLHLLETKSKRDLLPYIDGVFALVNEAYKDLYAVVLLSDAQIRYYTKAFFGFLDHRYVKIILDRQDRVAAFGASMPSPARGLQKCRGRLFPLGFIHVLRSMRTTDRLELLLIAVRPEHQNKGLGAVLIHETWKVASRRGIKYGETGPQLETNIKVQTQFEALEQRQHRRRRCFVKAI